MSFVEDNGDGTVQMEDSQGNAVVGSVDTDGNIQSITDSEGTVTNANAQGTAPTAQNTNVSNLKENDQVSFNGEQMKFVEDNGDGTVQMEDSQGNTVVGNVNESGDLESVTVPASNNGSTTQGNSQNIAPQRGLDGNNTDIRTLNENDTVDLDGEEYTLLEKTDGNEAIMEDSNGNQVIAELDGNGNISDIKTDQQTSEQGNYAQDSIAAMPGMNNTQTDINAPQDTFESKPLSAEQIKELGTIEISTIEAQSKQSIDANSIVESGMAQEQINGGLDSMDRTTQDVSKIDELSGWNSLKN